MRTRIALVCTIWGADFVDFFCRYSIATLLSPANLPKASATYDFTLLLYTTEQDLAAMQDDPNFRRLSVLVDIRPIYLASLPPAARTGHWIQWHHALLSSEEFSSFILLIPDCLYANDALQRIADSLEDNDFVFYCIPQVCIEPILPFLDSATHSVEGESSYTYLDFSKRDIAGLFVKFINPRYAVALHRPDYFVTHPEYVLRAIKGQIEIHELTCHALAVSNRAKSVSYAFTPLSESAKIASLDLLAVGVEYTLKYLEQYFRWPSSDMQLSRSSTLASWSYTFFERGINEYSKTKTEIAVSGLDAVAQQRTPITNPRIKYTRAAFEYYAAFYAVYAGTAGICGPDVRRAIALAMSLPGFRKEISTRRLPLTVLLPISDDAGAILNILYDLGDPQHVLEFLLMHVISERLTLKAGQAFILERIAKQPLCRPRFRIADNALISTISAAVTGQITSQGIYFNNDLIAYPAKIQYGPAHDFVQRLIG
jgi:hypothetical protein